MTREDVYYKCTERIKAPTRWTYKQNEDGSIERVREPEIIIGEKVWLPQEAIDAIIDCAVEEAILALKGDKHEDSD